MWKFHYETSADSKAELVFRLTIVVKEDEHSRQHNVFDNVPAGSVMAKREKEDSPGR